MDGDGKAAQIGVLPATDAGAKTDVHTSQVVPSYFLNSIFAPFCHIAAKSSAPKELKTTDGPALAKVSGVDQELPLYFWNFTSFV